MLLANVPGPGLLFGLMLLAAIAGGYAARLLHVPRVIGFLFAGVALKALLGGAYGGAEDAEALHHAALPLQAIKNLALGIILFTIGSVFERGHIKSVGPKVRKVSLLETLCVVGFVFAGCLVIGMVSQPQYGSANTVLALLLSLAAIATAPAATLFVLREYDARGATTDTILSLTGLNNVVCIVSFYVAFITLAAVGAIDTAPGISSQPGLALLFATVGTVLLGGVAGLLLSVLHSKLELSELLLVFFATFIVLGAGERWLMDHPQVGVSYNFLLTSLVAGGMFANLALEPQKLATSLRTIGAPIFAGFFVIAGFELHIEELTKLGWLGGGYVVCRTAGKYLGCRLGIRWAQWQENVSPKLGMALLCQAAVVIGLATFVKDNWRHEELAQQFTTLILGSIVVFEIIGPLAIKRCVIQAGEVKAVTLLRRVDAGREREKLSTIQLTRQALQRLVGRRQKDEKGEPETLKVKHIMRTSVQFLRARETLDDVLHFIERSTHHHFAVVDEEGTYQGVIHFADVREMIYDPLLRDLVTAVDLADPGAPAVPVDMALDELMEVFQDANVGTLPVVDDLERRRVVGMVEQRDVLRMLSKTPGG
jgi:Kef-type K+ transport system membrane component KefB/CBS domain-containing protein